MAETDVRFVGEDVYLVETERLCGRCADCVHLQSLELSDEIRVCPVLNIRLAVSSVQEFGCWLFEVKA